MLGSSLARSPVAKDGPLEGDHHLHRLHLEQPGVVRAQQDVQRRSARRHLRQDKKRTRPGEWEKRHRQYYNKGKSRPSIYQSRFRDNWGGLSARNGIGVQTRAEEGRGRIFARLCHRPKTEQARSELTDTKSAGAGAARSSDRPRPCRGARTTLHVKHYSVHTPHGSHPRGRHSLDRLSQAR